MASVQEQIENQTKALNESQSFASEEASKKFQTVKDEMHKVNKAIDDKLKEMDDDMDTKIKAIENEVNGLE